jgi:hypothetical protein
MNPFEKHMEILEKKCIEYSVSLKKDARSYYFDYDTRELGIPGHIKNKASLICGLLHEMGHAILDNHPFESIRKTPIVNRFIIISLEYEAWKTGLEILEETRLFEYKSYYIESWIKSWKNYIDYSADYTLKELKFFSESISPR